MVVPPSIDNLYQERRDEGSHDNDTTHHADSAAQLQRCIHVREVEWATLRKELQSVYE
jgi:hypothetical protein